MMNKLPDVNATLEELWTVKDQTAERFKSAADYFVYLQSQTKTSSSNAKPVLKKVSLARRGKVLEPSA